MNIRGDVPIPDDSSLLVTSTGLLGGSYLSISPGGSDKMLPPGGAITNVQGSVDLMGLVGRFIGGGNNQKPTGGAPQPTGANQAPPNGANRTPPKGALPASPPATVNNQQSNGGGKK
jgi:phospholipid/cholesterol/gamma-HCH transport system substrate-binding protein